MMKHGPVDVVVLALGEPHFDGSIRVSELEQADGSGSNPGAGRNGIL